MGHKFCVRVDRVSGNIIRKFRELSIVIENKPEFDSESNLQGVQLYRFYAKIQCVSIINNNG